MTWRVPLVGLDSLHRPIRGELLEGIARCLDRQNFFPGEVAPPLSALTEDPQAMVVSAFYRGGRSFQMRTMGPPLSTASSPANGI